MAKFTPGKISRNIDSAALPAARRAQAGHGRSGRIAHRIASLPFSLYGWVSGPPITKLERERAALADARNLRGRGTLIV